MKKRADSAFGIHFDFHAMPGEVVPTIYRPEVYAQMLDAVKPDYVQCDTKGHAGLSSYPTQVGTRADIRTDILRMMRDATAARGIPLFAHHSGLYDRACAAMHPDWAIVDIDGNVSKDYLSVFGPFADELLLPQLRELAGTYQLDGAWIDGECWATRIDYSPWAVNAYKASHNGQEPPRPGDAAYESYREFCREGFRSYVRHYVETIKAEYPRFQITSNWIFSHYMPEKNDVAVDFLSGDYSSTNSVCSARLHGRILEARNMPWDLMAWGHNAIPCSWMTHNRNTKELGQYCQEAAMIVAMGGGFEFFNIHYGIGGTVQQWAIPIWAQTAAFCRERAVCFHSRIRKELGILFPNERNAPASANLYGGCIGARMLSNWLDLLQDSHYSSKILFEYQLCEDDLSAYKVIVIPSAQTLAPKAITALETYVRNGGKLLVDAGSAHYFQSIGGFTCQATTDELVFVDGGNALAAGQTPCVTLVPTTATPFGQRFNDNIYESQSTPATLLTPYGSGRICTLTFDLGNFYATNRSSAIRRFLDHCFTDALGYHPDVTVTGSRFADVTVTEKDGMLLVSLVNVAGEHNVASVRSYDEIPPIGPLTVSFAPHLAVSEITRIPENRQLDISRNADGRATVTIDRLDIHTVLCVRS